MPIDSKFYYELNKVSHSFYMSWNIVLSFLFSFKVGIDFEALPFFTFQLTQVECTQLDLNFKYSCFCVPISTVE